MLSEAKLLADLLKHLRAPKVGNIFKHADGQTTGIPDVSFTAYHRTVWLEAKVAERWHIKKGSTELQRLRMRELAQNGIAWYVIWNCGDSMGGDNWTTCLVQPSQVFQDRTFSPLHSVGKVNHAFATEFVFHQLLGAYP